MPPKKRKKILWPSATVANGVTLFAQDFLDNQLELLSILFLKTHKALWLAFSKVTIFSSNP
jgi:hypothetical protein